MESHNSVGKVSAVTILNAVKKEKSNIINTASVLVTHGDFCHL